MRRGYGVWFRRCGSLRFGVCFEQGELPSFTQPWVPWQRHTPVQNNSPQMRSFPAQKHCKNTPAPRLLKRTRSALHKETDKHTLPSQNHPLKPPRPSQQCTRGKRARSSAPAQHLHMVSAPLCLPSGKLSAAPTPASTPAQARRSQLYPRLPSGKHTRTGLTASTPGKQ